MTATLLLAALFAAVSGAVPAHAASITVTTTADELNADGDCSLREAIQAVNTRSPVDACPAGTGNDLIVLPAGTYAITWAGGGEDNNATGDLDVFPAASPGGTVTIQGAGAGATILDGGGLDRVLHLIRDDSRLVMQDVTIRNGRLTDQEGAGILSWGALELRRVVLEDNVISGTSAAAVGGGLCLGCGRYTGRGVLEQAILRRNAANRGGGIFSNRPLTLTATSVVSNTARAGGAILSYGDLTLVNSTISGNEATFTGGISHYSNSLSILNSTIAYNRFEGIFVASPAQATLKNTLIAHNAGGGWGNCGGSGTVISQGHNLSDDATCAAWLTASSDLNHTNPQLGPLQNYGGPTPTHALLPGSPAIDAGTNVGCPPTDQRGVPRPQGPRCDIGAFERGFLLYLPLVLRSP